MHALQTGTDFISVLIELITMTYLIYIFLKYLVQFWKSKNSESCIKNLSINQIAKEEECSDAALMLLLDCCKLNALGFDCEWVYKSVNGKLRQQPVSLLQLASSSGYCCLFRLNKLGHIPHQLQEILESDKILKLGVSCDNDSLLLEKDYGVKVRNYLDLRYLYPLERGLASLAQNVIGVQLKKGYSISCTNWNQEVLTQDQIEYAAKDAWVAIEIFKKWLQTNSLTDRSINSLGLQGCINRPFYVGKKGNAAPLYCKESLNCNIKTPTYARKTPLYKNCWMLAPDGELLCTCDTNKAHWYVKRGLAEVCQEEPYTIKLLFNPTGRPSKGAEGEFYRQMKQNCCVVCGSQGPCMKHYVVPKEYRKHLPLTMKSHQNHDIVLTCTFCHSKAKMQMRLLKEKLAKMCDAPLYTPPSLGEKQLQKVKNICKTLLTSGKYIPEKRKLQLENKVKKFFKLSSIDNAVLEEIINNVKIKKEDPERHGLKVVKHFLDKGKLREFEEIWREFFLHKMNPKFLPKAWSITHNH